MSSQQKQKIPEISVLKGLALLAVIFQASISSVLHNITGEAEASILLGLLYNLAKFSAPVFIFVTGFILLYNQYNPAPYNDFIKAKAADLLFPFAIWTFVYTVETTGGFTGDFLQQLGRNIVTGNAAAHLWYVVMVFQFYLFYPFILKVFKLGRQKIAVMKAFIGLLAVLSALYITVLWGYKTAVFNNPEITKDTLLYYTDRTFIMYFIYFLAGGLAALHFDKWIKLVKHALPFVTFLFIGFFIWIGDELLGYSGVQNIDLLASTYLKPSMFFYVMSEIVLLFALARALVRSRSALYFLIRFFGQYSYGAFLSHALFMGGVNIIIQSIHTGMSLYVQVALTFIFTALFSISFAYLFSGVPYSKLVLGHFERMQIRWYRLIPNQSETYKK